MAERSKYAPRPGSMKAGHGPGAHGMATERPKNAISTFKRLFTYLSAQKWLLLLVTVCVMVSAVSGVAGTYLIRPVLNTLTEEIPMAEKLTSLGKTLLAMATLFLVGAACSYGQSAIMAQLAHRGVNRLRRDLFNRLQQLPLKYYDAHTHGELMSRFSNDADTVQMCLEQSLVSLISSVLTFAGTVIMMLYTCAPLFILTVLVLAGTAAVFALRGKKSRVLFQQQQSALGELNGNIQEMIEGLKVVKAFTHEKAAESEFSELNEQFYLVARDANYYASSLMPLSHNISNMGFALTALVGGAMSILGGFDLGGLGVYLQYSRNISQPLSQISQQMNALLSALAGAERIFDIMDTPPEIDEGSITLCRVREGENGPEECSERTEHWAWKVPQPDGSVSFIPCRGDVRLNDVTFGYVPEKTVLSHISLFAKPGQKIAFVGSTGAGKTTISNLVNRFYEIDGGVITYDGLDITSIRKADLRRSIAMVLQDTHLFTGTVMENIRYGRLDATEEECIEAAKKANAHSFIRRLPDGYDTMVTGDGINLSQGQRQLLAIARAAVAAPPVLVLDEATSSIDTRTEALIEKGLDQLMRGRTVFIIAHRLSTVRNANCIVVIERGEIVEKGTHEELLALKGRYYQLYTGQTRLE